MAQGNFQVDGLVIEDNQAGTRTITRDASTGAIKFIDAVTTGGILLHQLAGLQAVTAVYVVGKAGTGAQYTTIASAIAAAPVNATAAAPALILVTAGTYTEDLTIDKDGIWLVGLGGVTITAATATATITVKQNTYIPLTCTLQNLRITNAGNGEECIYLLGGASSTVGNGTIYIKDCDLVASGVGTYALRGVAVNNVVVTGGSCSGSSGTALIHCQECAAVDIVGMRALPLVQLDYDNTSATKPVTVGSAYRIDNCPVVGNLTSTLSGAGSLTITQSGCGTVTMNGDRTLAVNNSTTGNLTLNNTVVATYKGSTRGTASGAGTLVEPVLRGTATFTNESTKAVTLTPKTSDTSYTVALEVLVDDTAYISNKAVTGFTINFGGNQTTTVDYVVLRQV